MLRTVIAEHGGKGRIDGNNSAGKGGNENSFRGVDEDRTKLLLRRQELICFGLELGNIPNGNNGSVLIGGDESDLTPHFLAIQRPHKLSDCLGTRTEHLLERQGIVDQARLPDKAADQIFPFQLAELARSSAAQVDDPPRGVQPDENIGEDLKNGAKIVIALPEFLRTEIKGALNPLDRFVELDIGLFSQAGKGLKIGGQPPFLKPF
ncbi:MAG: hypothetical protein ACD_75C02373G0002 [uncultured bacterium]|nr:MAG: hypothetical protein ACD_75C02373G0002 [uncultured bacterium]